MVITRQRNQIQSPTKGLFIFNSTTNQIETNTGTTTTLIWTAGGAGITGGSSSNWSLTGNAGTVSGTNFLGTTDNVPLRFRINNQNAGQIDQLLNNTALGYLALSSSASDQGNTALGTAALANSTTGSGNSALGNVALQKNISGNYNTALGAGALQNNTTADANTAIGHSALANNMTGYVNIAVGEDALSGNSDGHSNVTLGNASLVGNRHGIGNVASDNVALRSNTTGQYNLALGTQALYYNTTGSYNTALGCNAGSLANIPNLNNSTALEANVVANASNQIVLGDSNITSLRCNVQTISSLSNKRIKENIKANVPGLRFITKLTPVTYHVNKLKEAKLVGYSSSIAHEDTVLHSGFLAQDVEAAAKAVNYNFEGVVQEENGKYYTLGYTLFVIPLVQTVKDLNAEVNQLKNELAAAKEKVTQVRLDKIEAQFQAPTRHRDITFNP